jgi:hypothetical protein
LILATAPLMPLSRYTEKKVPVALMAICWVSEAAKTGSAASIRLAAKTRGRVMAGCFRGQSLA